jgi:dolichol-phosphate mannosyltransferase
MFHVGFEAAVVAVRRRERKGGGSSYSFWKRLQLAFNSLVSYTDLPHRFLLAFGALVLLLSLGYAVALAVRYLVARESLPPGLTLLALLITVSLGASMMALGIIGMYVFRVYQEVLRRPRYITARTLNLGDPDCA